MPNAFEDKDLASRAGKLSGPSKKAKQWNALGDFMTKEGATKAMRIINSLDDLEFLEQYNRLLNYFKPKMQSTTNQTELSGKVSVEPIEWSGDDY